MWPEEFTVICLTWACQISRHDCIYSCQFKIKDAVQQRKQQSEQLTLIKQKSCWVNCKNWWIMLPNLDRTSFYPHKLKKKKNTSHQHFITFITYLTLCRVKPGKKRWCMCHLFPGKIQLHQKFRLFLWERHFHSRHCVLIFTLNENIKMC